MCSIPSLAENALFFQLKYNEIMKQNFFPDLLKTQLQGLKLIIYYRTPSILYRYSYFCSLEINLLFSYMLSKNNI